MVHGGQVSGLALLFYLSSQYRGSPLQPQKHSGGSRAKRGHERQRINGEDQNGENVAKCQFIT